MSASLRMIHHIFKEHLTTAGYETECLIWKHLEGYWHTCVIFQLEFRFINIFKYAAHFCLVKLCLDFGVHVWCVMLLQSPACFDYSWFGSCVHPCYQAKRLKIRENYAKFEEKIKDKGKELMSAWKESKDRGNHLLHKWEEKSKEFIGNFVDMFGKEGKLVSTFSKTISWKGYLPTAKNFFLVLISVFPVHLPSFC